MISPKAAEYMNMLQSNLPVGSEIATENASRAQESNNLHYNLRSREKAFQLEDLALVIMPDSFNKLAAQWQGPGTVVAVVSAHSYRIAMDTGAGKTLHANDLRKFVPRANSIGVIFDDDTEFGEIECCPVPGEEFVAVINELDLTHLDKPQQLQLRTLLIKHQVASHKIELVEGFQPKSMRPYRISNKLKIEVNKQIDQLLHDGKIRPSSSPYAHPIVCVAKPDNSVRVCTDLCYVNSGTINDAYPMRRPEDLLMDISESHVYFTLYCTSGYWQIPMKESDIIKRHFALIGAYTNGW